MPAKTSQQKKRQEERNWKPSSIAPLNQAQGHYLELLEDDGVSTVVAVGPAGTGKTFLACAYAAKGIFDKKYRGAVVVRPPKGPGKTQGFLPGDLSRKTAPWSRPCMDAFVQFLSKTKVDALVQAEEIEIGSLEHIRGITHDHKVMIMDEAQNSTVEEMEAFVTRAGSDTKIILCGDLDQSDLGPVNGLAAVLAAVEEGLVDLGQVYVFDDDDNVRSETSKQWARAFRTLKARYKEEQEAKREERRRLVQR